MVGGEKSSKAFVNGLINLAKTFHLINYHIFKWFYF